MVTGVGSLSSVGIGADNHYQALLEGKNGIETLPEWAEEYPCKVLEWHRIGWVGMEWNGMEWNGLG